VWAFISEDPIGLAGGANVYAYADASPTKYADPLGLTKCDIQVAFDVGYQNNPDFVAPAGGWEANIPRAGNLGSANVNIDGNGNPTSIDSIRLNERYLDPLSKEEAKDLYDTALHELLHGIRPFSRNHELGPIGDPLFYNEVATRLGVSAEAYERARQQTCQ